MAQVEFNDQLWWPPPTNRTCNVGSWADPHALIFDSLRTSTYFSFALLQEVLRLSGLLAINAGRSARTDKDLQQAAEVVQATNRTAQNGFPIKLDVPFGLVPRRTAAGIRTD